MNIDASDERAPYLIMFSDGLQFRYKALEIEPLDTNPHRSVFASMRRAFAETRHSLWRPKVSTVREKAPRADR